MIPSHVRLFVATAALGLLGTSITFAGPNPAPQQRGRDGQPPTQAQPEPTPQNLQVLPKDLSQAQVTQLMQNIASALGVQCGYCHMPAAAPEAGRGRGARGGRGVAGVAFDFPSDEKSQKRVARQMMFMVRDVNQTIEGAVGKTAGASTRVGCVTCHRGVTIPKQLQEILDQVTKEKGTPTAIAQYKELRKQFFGAQAYDFSEASLISYAQRATQTGSADDAITWLQLNLEYFPLSPSTYVGLAQAQQRKGDRDAAIRSLEKALELDPQNAQFRRQLDQLKGSLKSDR